MLETVVVILLIVPSVPKIASRSSWSCTQLSCTSPLTTVATSNVMSKVPSWFTGSTVAVLVVINSACTAGILNPVGSSPSQSLELSSSTVLPYGSVPLAVAVFVRFNGSSAVGVSLNNTFSSIFTLHPCVGCKVSVPSNKLISVSPS